MTAPKINLSREQRQGAGTRGAAVRSQGGERVPFRTAERNGKDPDRLKLTAEEVDRLIASLDRAFRQLGEAISMLTEEKPASG